MLIRTPRAPRIETSSSNGLSIAARAASSARPSPSPSPIPIIAVPMPFMIVRTSAKSRLIRPGMIIRSVMPRTPEYKTSSAMRKASANVVRSLAMRKRFWFGTTISVSTASCINSRPLSAVLIRCVPSNPNGLVTTPIVRMPLSCAAFAMTGAAPVPVPPPMPAATKTMCAPSRASMISSKDSSAEAAPTSGRAPAPRPAVVSKPSWMRFSVFERSIACASVLAT